MIGAIRAAAISALVAFAVLALLHLLFGWPNQIEDAAGISLPFAFGGIAAHVMRNKRTTA